MADRNTNWDRERNNERDDWQQREEAWRRDRESASYGERYREPGTGWERPDDRRTNAGRGSGALSEYERRRYAPRGDYGPGAFNPGAGRDNELFGTGSRGFGSTWGGSGVYTEGRSLYNDQPNDTFEGRHAGKGPKGYRRSDDRIREEICECLTRHSHIDASEIEVRVKDGEVTFTGTVERREEKRLAEDAAEKVPGVIDVHNQLRIQAAESPQGSGSHLSTEQPMEPTGAGSRRR